MTITNRPQCPRPSSAPGGASRAAALVLQVLAASSLRAFLFFPLVGDEFPLRPSSFLTESFFSCCTEVPGWLVDWGTCQGTNVAPKRRRACRDGVPLVERRRSLKLRPQSGPRQACATYQCSPSQTNTKPTHRHLFVNVLISHPRQPLQISGQHLCDCGTWAWAGGRRGVGVLVLWGASSMVALV